MNALERLMLTPEDFPLEVTLSSGDRYVIPRHDYTFLHPNKQDVVLFPDSGPYHVLVNPAHIVSFKPLRKIS